MKKHIGLIGASSHLVKRILPSLQGIPEISIDAIASRDTEKAKEIAKTWNIPIIYNRYEDLLENPTIDGVYISTPPALHATWIKKALSKDKHVLCEKPLVLTHRELYPLLDLASKKQKVLMPAWMYRFHPQWPQLKNLLSQKAIGDIRLINIHISYEAKDKNNIRYNKSLGGGVLNDIGCYALSALSFLFETFPFSLTCSSLSDKKTQVDILTTGTLFYPDFQTTFTVCMEMYRSQRLRIFGTHGMIEMEYPFNPPQDNETKIFLFSQTGDKTFSFPPFNPYTEEWKVFIQSMQNSTYPISQAEMFKETFLLEQCRQAIHTKKTIHLKIPSQLQKKYFVKITKNH